MAAPLTGKHAMPWNFTWPDAAAFVGALATISITWLGVLRIRNGANGNGHYAKATDMADVKARLGGLESGQSEFRKEVRERFTNVEALIRSRR